MNRDGDQSLTEVFANFSNNFTLNDAPGEIISYARLLVLDLVGCALGGGDTAEAKAALAACQAMDAGSGTAALWGTGIRASLRNAAMYNGTIAHVLELDDFLGVDHTGAVVVPALFAVMEHEGEFDETRFLEAMILGYEIGRRMLDCGGGYSKHNSTGWHTTGTLGAYAAAVAVGKYLRLPPVQLVAAIGLSGSVAGGTWAFNMDGSMSKRFHPGMAAQNGITAAYLARQGFTGPRFVLEADWGGYFAQFAPNHDCDTDALFTELGSDLRLGWAGIKPYACCRGCHSAIDVMHQMRTEHGVTAEKVSDVLVKCSLSQHRQLGNPSPTTVAEAQLSLPFAIASALRFDTLGTDRFSEAAFNDPITLALAQKTRFDVVPGWTFGKEPEFQVTMADGQTHSGFVPAAKGDPSNPVPTDQVVEKFRQLIAGQLPRGQQDALIAFGLSQENHPDLQSLVGLIGQAHNS